MEPQKGLMGFMKLMVRDSDDLRYEMQNPGKDWGGLLNYSGIWKGQIFLPDSRRDTYCATLGMSVEY